MAKLDNKERNHLPPREFAFPKQHKEPLEDERHVRNAIARFNQVSEVTDEERDEAWARIMNAAKKFDIAVQEKDWHELKGNPHTG